MNGSDEAPEDSFLEQVVAQALEPYKAVLPPARLAEMAAFLRDALGSHPVGSTLLDRARPRAAPETSGDQAKHGSEAVNPEAKKKSDAG